MSKRPLKEGFTTGAAAAANWLVVYSKSECTSQICSRKCSGLLMLIELE